MKNPISVLIAVVLALVASVSQAAPISISGNVTYVRNWTQVCSNNVGDRIQCVDEGATLPLKRARLRFNVTGGGATSPTWATVQANGTYTAVLPNPGTYAIDLVWSDSQNNSGMPDTTKVALVETGGYPYTALYNTLSTGHAFITSGQTYNYAIPLAGALNDRANTFEAAVLFNEVWGTGGIQPSLALDNAGGVRARIRNVETTASGYGYCISSGNCVMTSGVKFSNRDPSVVWHELGHGMDAVVTYTAQGDYRASMYYTAGSCANITNTASRAFEEGWADFVDILTRFTPAGIPPYWRGSLCNSCEYLPTGSQPAAPACGPAAIERSRDNVTKALMELVDTTQEVEFNCRPESVQLSPGLLVTMLVVFSNNVCYTPPSPPNWGTRCGVEEGGIVESWEAPGVPASNSWPYAGGLPVGDRSGLLDYLGFIKKVGVASGTSLQNIWANSCWQPGDSATVLP